MSNPGSSMIILSGLWWGVIYFGSLPFELYGKLTRRYPAG